MCFFFNENINTNNGHFGSSCCHYQIQIFMSSVWIYIVNTSLGLNTVKLAIKTFI